MSETIVNAIKDALLILNLQLEDWGGQTYDGADNMLKKRNNVVTRVKAD